MTDKIKTPYHSDKEYFAYIAKLAEAYLKSNTKVKEPPTTSSNVISFRRYRTNSRVEYLHGDEHLHED